MEGDPGARGRAGGPGPPGTSGATGPEGMEGPIGDEGQVIFFIFFSLILAFKPLLNPKLNPKP